MVRAFHWPCERGQPALILKATVELSTFHALEVLMCAFMCVHRVGHWPATLMSGYQVMHHCRAALKMSFNT